MIGNKTTLKYKILEDKYNEKYLAFLKDNPRAHFLQSPNWSEVKTGWDLEVVVCEDEAENIKASVSVLIRKIPHINQAIMYAPRGPVCETYDEAALRELIKGLSEVAKKHKAFVFKTDPDILSEDNRYKELVKKLGFKINENIDKVKHILQPKYEVRLDLENKSEEEVLKSFNEKTRYNIRLAGKKGVVVKEGTREDLKIFHNLMIKTGSRDGFIIKPLEYFEKMYDAIRRKYKVTNCIL